MGFDKKKIKQIRQLMLLAAVLILGLIYSQEVFNAISMLVGIMKPCIYGGVIAFVLNIPLCQIENHMLFLLIHSQQPIPPPAPADSPGAA